MSLSEGDREHAWVLFQVLDRTRRGSRSQDDVISHTARVMAEANELVEGSGARFEFEVEVAAAIRLQLRRNAPSNPDSAPWGPWIGVPKERQNLCAILDCATPGKAHRCFADGSSHHHGCVHYEVMSETLYAEHRLKLRTGWGLLCDEHNALLVALFDKVSGG